MRGRFLRERVIGKCRRGTKHLEVRSYQERCSPIIALVNLKILQWNIKLCKDFQLNDLEFRSLDTDSQAGKVFKCRGNSILSLSQDDNDLQLLINQEELVKNLLAPFKSHTSSLPSSLPALTDPILDFTLCQRNRLYLLYPNLLAVLDLANLLSPRDQKSSPSKTVFDTQPDFLDWIAFPETNTYNAIKSVNIRGSLHLLLYNIKGAGGTITHLTLNDQGNSDQQVLVSDVFESDQVQYKLREGGDATGRAIQNVQICGYYACVLMERNEVQVVDLRQKQVVFKAQYKDSSAKIVKLYYIDPSIRYADIKNRDESPHSSEQEDNTQQEERFKDDEIVGEDDEDQSADEVQQFRRQGQKRLPLFRNATVKEVSPDSEEGVNKPFAGFFLFVENVSQKDSTSQKVHNYFEKLSIAKILNKSAGNPQKALEQRLQQLDYLKISEKSRKLVEFDQRRGIVFLMNKKAVSSSSSNSQLCLKLYAIQLKQYYMEESINNSDSDNEDRFKNSPIRIDDRSQEASGIKFSFIKGMQLQMGSQVAHNIATSQTSSAKRPKFFKYLTMKKYDGPLSYYLYTSIGGQIIAHSLRYPLDLQQPHTPTKPTLQSSLPFHLPQQNSQPDFFFPTLEQPEHQSIFGLDPFFSIGATHVADSDPLDTIDTRNFIQPTMSFGCDDQEEEEEMERALQKQLDNVQDEVTREMQEAIERDIMEGINDCKIEDIAIIEENQEVLVIDSQLELVRPKEEEVKVEVDAGEDAQTDDKAPTGKEIHLSADQFKIIQASKQANALSVTEKKKKKKAAKKAAAAVQGNNNTTGPQIEISKEEVKEKKSSPIQQSRPLPQQTSSISANSLPFTFVTVPQAQATVPTYQPKSTVAPPVTKSTTAQMIPQPIQQPKQKPINTANSKSQEDTMLDTFAELTKKYQDLSQKFQKLQDQLSNQTHQQAELDRCIAKNIGQVVPSVIELQLKEKIVPLVLGHMRGIDRNIRDEVLPQVQNQVQEVISKLIRQNKVQLLAQQQEEDIKKKGIRIDESIQNEIKVMVVEEFAKAMEQGIKPMLHEQFAGIITEVKANLKFLSEEVAKKVAAESDKNNETLQKLHQRIDQLHMTIHGPAQNIYQAINQPQYPPHYPHYPHYGPQYNYPPPYPHYQPPSFYQGLPQYPPPQIPQIHGAPIVPYAGPYPGLAPQNIAIDQRLQTNDLNITSAHSSGYPGSIPLQYQPLQTQHSSNYSPHVIPPQFNPNQLQPNYSNQSQAQMGFQQPPTTKQTTPSFSANDIQQPPPLKLQPAQQSLQGTNQDIMLMFNDDGEAGIGGGATGSITPVSGLQHNSTMEEIKINGGSGSNQFVPVGGSSKIAQKFSKEKSISSFGSNPSVEEVNVSPNKKKGKQAQNGSQKPQIDQQIQGGDPQVPAPNKKWQILPYMKEVATQGKSSSADFLLCGSQEFLQETVQFVEDSPHIITNQYSCKLIHQFIKKVYNRAKENEKARKGAAILLDVFIKKIYKQRENMKQLLIQATSWENEIKKLIEDDA